MNFKRIKPAVIFILSLLIIFFIWQALSYLVNSELILPDFFAVAESFATLFTDKTFYLALVASFCRVLAAFFLSAAAGLVLGVLCGLSPAVQQLLSFPISFIRSTPVVSLILIAVFWFRTTTIPVFAAFLMAVPVIISSVSQGILNTSQKLLDMAQVYGFSKKQKLLYIYFESLRPFFTGSLISSFGMCWKVVAAGEVLVFPREGLGTLLQSARIHLETQRVMALTACIVVLSFIFERILSFLLSHIHFSSVQIHGRAGNIIQHGQAGESQCPSITVKNLFMERGGKVLYRGFETRFESASVTALIASSGTGKTSLLDYISSILKADEKISGTVEFDRLPEIAYIFQDGRLLENLTVLQNVMIPLVNRFDEKSAEKRAQTFINKCGLTEKAHSPVKSLSGGQKQRACLARAFAYGCNILLMDEPFNSLDLPSKINLIQLLKKLLKDDPKTVIFVSHNIREISLLCDRVKVLSGSPLTQKVNSDIGEFNSVDALERAVLQNL